MTVGEVVNKDAEDNVFGGLIVGFKSLLWWSFFQFVECTSSPRSLVRFVTHDSHRLYAHLRALDCPCTWRIRTCSGL
jgi:hypothetical protein